MSADSMSTEGNIMKKILKVLSNIVSAGLSLFCFTGFLAYFPSLSAVIFLFIAVLMLPINRLQEIIKNKFKINNKIKNIALVILFFVGVMGVPVTNPLESEESEISVVPVVSETLESEPTATPVLTDSASEQTVSFEDTVTAELVVNSDVFNSEASAVQDKISDSSTFSVRFFDVGQADAALVECDGRYMLIDGGNKADSNLIYSVLKSEGVSHLDMVVGTHAHEDHIGGLPGAFNYTTADVTLCPVTSYDTDAFEDFKRYADQNGGGITVPSVGDTYTLGSAKIEILGLNAGDVNNNSIVLKIQYGETSFLFTGDAEREAEQAILNRGADLSATVLKVGHHGSDTSTTYPFLREIMPEYAVISVGDDNSYGHPTDDTLSRLRDADVKVFRTDMQGDVVCTSDGKTVTFTVEKNADADTLAPKPTPKPTPTPTPEPEQEQQVSQSGGGTTYVLNTNTHKFHYQSCSSVKKMKDSNKAFHTGTRDEVIAMGYSPCGNCHP